MSRDQSKIFLILYFTSIVFLANTREKMKDQFTATTKEGKTILEAWQPVQKRRKQQRSVQKRRLSHKISCQQTNNVHTAMEVIIT